MADEPGFEANGEWFPFPQAFRLVDPVLVREVTGLEWNDFADLLDQENPATLAGLVAVAVWQKYPKWRRDRVVEFVSGLSINDLRFPDMVREGDAVPPPDTTGPSPGPLTGSSDEPEASDATLASTGSLA